MTESTIRDNSHFSFKIEKILNIDNTSKIITLLGVKDEKKGVLLLEKLEFSEEKFVNMNAPLKDFIIDPSNCALVHENDIYSTWLSNGLPDSFTSQDVKIIVIWPATEGHIAKYSKQERFVIVESPELYHTITKPWIEEYCTSKQHIAWIHNILDAGAESERVLFKDDSLSDGYYLVKNSRWISTNVTSLSALAICKRKDIRCLRDLNANHLPLLRRIAMEVPRFIQENFNVPSNQLNLLIHYFPSYFHLYVHVMHTESEFHPGSLSGRGHLLNDVIDAIETFGSDYWQRKTITCIVENNHPMYSRLFTCEKTK